MSGAMIQIGTNAIKFIGPGSNAIQDGMGATTAMASVLPGKEGSMGDYVEGLLLNKSGNDKEAAGSFIMSMFLWASTSIDKLKNALMKMKGVPFVMTALGGINVATGLGKIFEGKILSGVADIVTGGLAMMTFLPGVSMLSNFFGAARDLKNLEKVKAATSASKTLSGTEKAKKLSILDDNIKMVQADKTVALQNVGAKIRGPWDRLMSWFRPIRDGFRNPGAASKPISPVAMPKAVVPKTSPVATSPASTWSEVASVNAKIDAIDKAYKINKVATVTQAAAKTQKVGAWSRFWSWLTGSKTKAEVLVPKVDNLMIPIAKTPLFI